jgi:hypothetical protein
MWDKTKTFYEQPTVGGYIVGDVLSALQKAIRRGDVFMACYWSAELFDSGFGSYLWNRLLIISAEDCWGTVTQHVEALRQEVKALESADQHVNRGKAKDKKVVLFALKAAHLLAAAQHCRDTDNFYCLVYKPHAVPEEKLLADLEQARKDKPPIPPEAFDKDTRKGKERLQKKGLNEKQMTDLMIVTETKALKPRHKGFFDDLPGQVKVIEIPEGSE